MKIVRPAKDAIRARWLAIIQEIENSDSAYPTYLTLAGAAGHDVQMLIDEGIIRQLESGAISDDTAHVCVAIENGLKASMDLKKRFPGLKVINQDIRGVLHGDSLVKYPERPQDQRICQAHIVNLDLQQTLNALTLGNELVFPVIRWIEKLGNLHLEAPHSVWHLLLTLNATIDWDAAALSRIRTILERNAKEHAAFLANCERTVGTDLLQRVFNDITFDVGHISLPERQRMLLAAVPKLLIERLVRQDWAVVTVLNAEYGGSGGAPMVTYIFRFERDTGVPPMNTLYQDAVCQCLKNPQRVNEDGAFVPLPTLDSNVS